MAQRFLGRGRRLKGMNKHLTVGSATLVRQLERIQQILRRTWAERRRLAASHRSAVAAQRLPLRRPLRPLLEEAAPPPTRKRLLQEGGARSLAAPTYHTT